MQFTTALHFLSISPLILAHDVEEGISFYRNALDFHLVYRDTELAQFAIVGLNRVKFHIFSNHNRDSRIGPASALSSSPSIRYMRFPIRTYHRSTRCSMRSIAWMPTNCKGL